MTITRRGGSNHRPPATFLEPPLILRPPQCHKPIIDEGIRAKLENFPSQEPAACQKVVLDGIYPRLSQVTHSLFVPIRGTDKVILLEIEIDDASTAEVIAGH